MLVSVAILLWPKSNVAGVRLPQSGYLSSVFDRFRYASLVEGVLSGDARDLGALVDFWCGGGAGCYDHGAVIVDIMYAIGDQRFYDMAHQLNSETVLSMAGYIAAGFEYGGFVDAPYDYDFREDFPKTLALIDLTAMRAQH